MKKRRLKKTLVSLSTIAACTALISAGNVSPVFASSAKTLQANTPIKYVVVIFDENESFDHYFGTYPFAKNTSGEPLFFASPGTPAINGLTPALLMHNPNSADPQRLPRSMAHTQDFDHGYTSEQKSFDGGLMDKFVQNDGHGNAEVMDYYDGNTVTALWNLAQHFSMNDNYFGANLGPSTPGAINVVSGNTHGATVYTANATLSTTKMNPNDKNFPRKAVTKNGTLYGDIDPYYDYASKRSTASMSGRNIGDLMNRKGLTWGCFFGGYDDPKAIHKNIAGEKIIDYIPHHEPFQYYGATSNIKHVRPVSVAMIGHTDRANHQYDITDFWAAAESGHLPNYSFLKAPAYQDGHPSYSDPIDEQRWLVETINKLESLPTWKNTAIFVTYDDSDGWYDHVMPPIMNHSQDPDVDAMEGKGKNVGDNMPLNGYQDRLGYGPRMPMIVVSPYAKHNAVIHTIADQSSVLKFVEDNWNLGRIGNGSFDTMASSLDNMFDFTPGYSNQPVFLDPATGEPVTQLKPFKENGHLYMSLQDLTQSLNVLPHEKKDHTWFMYNNHLVEIPHKGNSIKVDMANIDLEGKILSKHNVIYLPLSNLSKALNITPVEYKSNEILFRQKAADNTNSFSEKYNTRARTVNYEKNISTAKLSIEENNNKNLLSIGSPIEVPSTSKNSILVNQIINGAQKGQKYDLAIKAPAMKNRTVYISFSTGTIDTKGTLTVNGEKIGKTPVAVKLNADGKANITYTVSDAPTNWDAYDNDNIVITDSADITRAGYKNEISIFS
ncbi:phospholipase C [Pectinatus sottacetonis]|uniref:phospholipase C n=1 Tax=Pectinatus sottacetonis TaxID=1002795 RepID=UPI0018C64559